MQRDKLQLADISITACFSQTASSANGKKVSYTDENDSVVYMHAYASSSDIRIRLVVLLT